MQIFELSSQLTTSLKVTKFGYIEEVTRGAVPPDAAFVSLNTENFNPSTTINVVEQPLLGSPFIFKQPKTGERYRFALEFGLTDINFLQYCVNTAGAKNRDKSPNLFSRSDDEPGRYAGRTLLFCQRCNL